MTNDDGVAVMLADETEDASNNPASTEESVSRWSRVASRTGSNVSVLFDLCNECRIPFGGESAAWASGGMEEPTSRALVSK